MRLLIAGFYNHDNFGDDCLQLSLENMFQGNELKFCDLANIDLENLESYHCILVSGGDLINDFYGLKYTEVLQKYDGYKIAAGVGVSFEECLSRKYNLVFDDIVLRSKIDLPNMRKLLGTLNTHYMPDLTFSLYEEQIVKRQFGINVGIFLVGSIKNNLSLLFTINRFIEWLLIKGYNVNLIPMYSGKDTEDNDVKLCDYIYKIFERFKNIKSHARYGYREMMDVMKTLDFGICMRFHSAIFCVKLGIPFISISLTRKIDIFSDELSYNPKINVERFHDYNISNIDINDAKSKFLNIVENAEKIRKDLLYLSDLNYKSFENNKIVNLVKNRKKRIIHPIRHHTVDPEEVYVKYRNEFLSRGIIPETDDPRSLISTDIIEKMADSMCYDITGDTNNEFSFGTRCNFINTLSSLRGMVYYIYHEYSKKVYTPKININYIKQISTENIHRAGWNYSISPLFCYSGDHGVFLDTYGDRTFGWASDILVRNSILPYTNHWVAFFHHTFDETFSPNNCENIFKSQIFRSSLNMCKGIFCLTEYLAKLFRKRLTEIGYGWIPVNSLHHPTIFVDEIFDFNKFMENTNKMLINIGSWYRNPITIYRLANEKGTYKLNIRSLKGKRMESNLPSESLHVCMKERKLYTEGNVWSRMYIKYINDRCDEYSSGQFEKIEKIIRDNDETYIDIRNHNSEDLVKEFIDNLTVIDTLTNEEYDKIFVENVVFLDLVDASTVNTILECIVRYTPIIVNRIPPTVELLGENYPLFYEKYEDIKNMINYDKIKIANEYMKKINTKVYKIDNFIESFMNSQIYKNL